MVIPYLTLSFAQPFIEIPREVAAEFFAQMNEIIRALNGIPRGSTVWKSLVSSWLVLPVRDWRFHYKIDPEAEKIVVMAAAKRQTDRERRSA